MKAKVVLSIGYPTASRSDIIEVDDDELAECETEKEKEELLNRYWIDWSNNYIEGDIRVIENDVEYID